MNGTRMCAAHSAGGFYDIKMKFSTVIKNIPGDAQKEGITCRKPLERKK